LSARIAARPGNQTDDSDIAGNGKRLLKQTGRNSDVVFQPEPGA
jgi:hypothetical protein